MYEGVVVLKVFVLCSVVVDGRVQVYVHGGVQLVFEWWLREPSKDTIISCHKLSCGSVIENNAMQIILISMLWLDHCLYLKPVYHSSFINRCWLTVSEYTKSTCGSWLIDRLMEDYNVCIVPLVIKILIIRNCIHIHMILW